MYFPHGIAKRLKPSAASAPDCYVAPLPASLADIAKLGGAREESVLCISAEAQGELLVVLTETELSVWTAKPSIVLCKVKRSHLSIRQHGNNQSVFWHQSRQDGRLGLVVLTERSGLLYFDLQHVVATSAYELPSKPTVGPAYDFGHGVGEGPEIPSLVLKLETTLQFEEERIVSCCPAPDHLLISTSNPPSLLALPWHFLSHNSTEHTKMDLFQASSATSMAQLDFLENKESVVSHMTYSQRLSLYTFATSDGRVYVVRDVQSSEAPSGTPASASASVPPVPRWKGACVYPSSTEDEGPLPTCVAINSSLSLLAVGLADGTVQLFTLSAVSLKSHFSHAFSLSHALKSTASHLQKTGACTCLAWTSDGYALAVGWSNGWSLWSAYGRLTTWALNGDVGSGSGDSEVAERSDTFEDFFLFGVQGAAWTGGDFELWIATRPPKHPKQLVMDEQLYVLPFAKSAVVGMHSPDNTNHAFLQMEDRALVYRGADQPDMSVINPESDVWQSIKYPAAYVANNWPIRLACISSDARLLAIAGQFGLCHYNSLSGRWKCFDRQHDEESFTVHGGMLWYENILIAAIRMTRSSRFKIRLHSRDRALAAHTVLYEEDYPAPVIAMSMFDNSLLVYTADNTFTHYLINTAKNGTVSLKLCGSIGFEGVVRDPSRVRGLSWLVPRSQQRFGDPADDLDVATIIFLVDGKLVLLRPRKSVQEEVKYDLQVLADKIEFYWTHLSGIGTLENSLWGWDGSRIRVWLNALTIEASTSSLALQPVKESFSVPLSFYPLSVLMDKGIVIGVDHETFVRRTLDFAQARISTTTHLFLHHVLRFHLSHNQVQEAVLFASFYQNLIYFAHALEILLHGVLEDEADAFMAYQKSDASPTKTSTSDLSHDETQDGRHPELIVLPRVVAFLDHFQESLQVVVACARKTEITRWTILFDAVGKPGDLFESCIESGMLKVAASYLLVLHNLESVEQSSNHTIRLLKAAMAAEQWPLCKELLRFLFSLDQSGSILKAALSEAGALPPQYLVTLVQEPASAPTNGNSQVELEADDDMSSPEPPQELQLDDKPTSPAAQTASIFGLGLFSRVASFGALPLERRPSDR